jgi:hypothetical protein
MHHAKMYFCLGNFFDKAFAKSNTMSAKKELIPIAKVASASGGAILVKKPLKATNRKEITSTAVAKISLVSICRFPRGA